jgi:Glycoside hydrolase family 44
MSHQIRHTAVAILAALLFANSSSGSGKGSLLPSGATREVPSNSGSPSRRAVAPHRPTSTVNVTVDVLNDRHSISPYVYGGSYPKDAPTITDSGLTVVRWGGNATSRYNWKTFTNNAAADWYFEDFGYTEIGDGDSIKYIQDVKAAGSNPLMTMVMLPWVAKTSGWSFSVAKYGAQCGADPYNSDAGDGVLPDCQTVITGNDPTDANVELKDSPQNGDPPGTVYRDQWAAALATAFGSAPHFYNMDNEIDIWGGTHRDVHPNASAYDEMRDTYFAEAGALKGWDPNAIRLGPVSCCWWFYWNGANNNDKGAHAGVDFLPWWLNEVYWKDQLAGTRSVDVFDIHAYPDGPDTSHFTQGQKQALSLRIYRDYWDPKYVSESPTINQKWATFIQPSKRIPFRIPRMRALANMIYPGTPLSFTEWSAAFAGESDFSTALADADAYGILGRDRLYLASRWVAPDPANPNYQALKLFRNYDGQHHAFAMTSVSATNDGNPNFFSSYAALDSTGTTLTLMVINKSPQAAVQTQFTVNGFTPKQVTTYTLSPKSPTKIVASSQKPWTAGRKFAPYTATLLVITGSMSATPSADWDLNPDTIMVPARGITTLQPKIVSGSGTVTLGTPQSDNGITLVVTQPNVTSNQDGSISVTAGTTPGFYHFTVPSIDNVGVAETQSGWILVGNPPAKFAKTGDHQKGAPGSNLNLSVTLNAGKSGGSPAGGTVLFTTDSGTLSSRLVTTDSSGNAPVVLTLPPNRGTVHVTAEGQFGLGHPVAKFTETAQ